MRNLMVCWLHYPLCQRRKQVLTLIHSSKKPNLCLVSKRIWSCCFFPTTVKFFIYSILETLLFDAPLMKKFGLCTETSVCHPPMHWILPVRTQHMAQMEMTQQSVQPNDCQRWRRETSKFQVSLSKILDWI